MWVSFFPEDRLFFLFGRPLVVDSSCLRYGALFLGPWRAVFTLLVPFSPLLSPPGVLLRSPSSSSL